MGKKTINKKQITDLIQSLSYDKKTFDFNKTEMFFSLEDLGTLYLNHEETKEYREVLNSMINDMDSEIISPKAIEKLFQQTILKSLDLGSKQSSIPLEKRIKDSLKCLEESLNETPQNIILYYPIEGLADEGLPFKFGKIEFRIFNNEDRVIFRKTIKNNWSDGSSKTFLLDCVKRLRVNNKIVARLEVNAIDNDAAFIMGEKELSLSIDVLNFYSDLLPYHKGFIYLPGESQQKNIEVPIIRDDTKPGVWFKYHLVGPLMNLSIIKLVREDKKKNLGLIKISNKIAGKHNYLEERIISAMKWAGSATIEQDKEKSFLEYAISLETIILLEQNRSELNHRLGTRVAQLLSQDIDECIKIKNDIDRLYGIRSEIVHDGRYQVNDFELGLIRIYAKRSILRLLTDVEFDSMDKDNILDWFNKRTFR